MELRTIIISIIVFSLGVGALASVYSDFVGVPEYNIIKDPSYDPVYQEINSTLNSTVILSKNIYKKGEENSSITGTDAEASLWRSSWGAIRLVYGSFGLAYSIVGATAGVLYIPAWIIGGLMGIVMVTIAFTLISAVLRRAI